MKTETNSVDLMKCVPPKPIKRNEYGLLEHITYTFNEDGTVNWRKMINPKHLVLSREKQPEIEKTYNKSIDQLQLEMQTKVIDENTIDDKYKLQLLASSKELALIRGYRSVTYTIAEANPQYVAVQCQINWIPNYENPTESLFAGLADCHADNCNKMGQRFLLATAENRSFVRAVRNYLNIPIVGKDEIGGKNGDKEPEDNPSASSPHANFKELLKKEKYTKFEQVKELGAKHGFTDKHERAANDKLWDSANWTKLTDIPPLAVMELTTLIKEKKT